MAAATTILAKADDAFAKRNSKAKTPTTATVMGRMRAVWKSPVDGLFHQIR